MKLTHEDLNHLQKLWAGEVEPLALGQIQQKQQQQPFPRLRVLFLVSVPPASITATWPPYQNPTLPQLVSEWGALSDVRSWRDDGLDTAAIAKYDKVTFLWCNDYHEFPEEFLRFLKDVLLPVRALNPRTHIFNDPSIVLWNADKHYLLDLAKAGFRVPHTKFLRMGQVSHQDLFSVVADWSTPLVLKPSISGSARNCHLIKTPNHLNSRDVAFLDKLVATGTHGDLVLQEYEPGITSGEWSLMFVNGKHTHTVLKVPQRGEFRINGEFGGRAQEVSLTNVPQAAVDVAYDVFDYLSAKFSSLAADDQTPLIYARIDGVMHDDAFVLMEVEVIEPHMWLEKPQGFLAIEELRKAFITPSPEIDIENSTSLEIHDKNRTEVMICEV